MTPAIGHILKAANCDVVVFDMEHSGYGYDTIRAALRTAEAAGLATIVRPPSKLYHDIARALDIGSKSLMFQMVDTPEEARDIVACMKFRPRGIRGVTTQHYYDGFSGGDLAPKLAAEDRATTMIALIESRLGVENADAIAAVDGVDCLYLGQVDLSTDLGIPGQYDDPRLMEATYAMAEACRKHGKHFIWDYGRAGKARGHGRRSAPMSSCAAPIRSPCGMRLRGITSDVRARYSQKA